MTTLFSRAVWVVVDNLQVKDLRMQFKVHKTLKKNPNTCEVRITNLAQSTRAQMRTKGAKLILLAGYGTRVQQLFSGTARRINHVHERPEWTTSVECGDGEGEMLFNRVSGSFRPGTSFKDVARAVAKSLISDTGNLEEKLKPLTDQFVNGYTAHGRSAAVFDKLLKGRDLDWSIQDGRLQLLGPGEHNSDEVTVVDSDHGLVGSPAFGTPEKKSGVEPLKFKMLLQPQLRPGSRVKVQGRALTGKFRVTEVLHTGDTAGQEWYTEVEATAL